MPVSYRVNLTARASRDIAGIHAYIEQNSPQNATAVARELLGAIDSLEVFPNRHREHVRQRDPSKTVRSMPVPPFLVYYRVDERHQVVEILRVLHGARRQPRRFD